MVSLSLDRPGLDRGGAIARARAPHERALARDVATAARAAAHAGPAKGSGVAETIDSANALQFLGRTAGRRGCRGHAGAVVKDHEIVTLVTARLAEVVGEDG
jgi:hypothetical protein